MSHKNNKNNLLRFKKRAKEVANDFKMSLPKGTYYRYGIQECWECHKLIIVFAWPTEYLWEPDEPKMKPLPHTVNFLEKAGYWGNMCPNCNSLQGEFYLKAEPDGAFFSVECKDDSKESFDEDMLRISEGASINGLLGGAS